MQFAKMFRAHAILNRTLRRLVKNFRRQIKKIWFFKSVNCVIDQVEISNQVVLIRRAKIAGKTPILVPGRRRLSSWRPDRRGRRQTPLHLLISILHLTYRHRDTPSGILNFLETEFYCYINQRYLKCAPERIIYVVRIRQNRKSALPFYKINSKERKQNKNDNQMAFTESLYT